MRANNNAAKLGFSPRAGLERVEGYWGKTNRGTGVRLGAIMVVRLGELAQKMNRA